MYVHGYEGVLLVSVVCALHGDHGVVIASGTDADIGIVIFGFTCGAATCLLISHLKLRAHKNVDFEKLEHVPRTHGRPTVRKFNIRVFGLLKDFTPPCTPR